MYSNPAVQIAAVEAGALQQLIRLLSVETSASFRSRLLAALSSLIRQFPFAQRKFLELGGLQTLSSLLIGQSFESHKLSIKAVTLVSDLLTERVSNSMLLLIIVLCVYHPCSDSVVKVVLFLVVCVCLWVYLSFCLFVNS